MDKIFNKTQGTALPGPPEIMALPLMHPGHTDFFFLGGNCRCFRKRSIGQSRDSVRHASTEKHDQPVPLCSRLCVPGTTLRRVTGHQQHLCVPHGCPARHVFPLQDHQPWAWNSTPGSFAGSIYTSKRFVLNMCSAPLGWSLTGI